MKYNGVLHIAVCGCDDIEIVEHEFNPAGKCVCGYEKPPMMRVREGQVVEALVASRPHEQGEIVNALAQMQ